MKPIAQLKYRIDHNDSAYKDKAVAAIIFIGMLVLLFFWSKLTLLIVFIITTITLKLYYRKAGVLEFYLIENEFYVKNVQKNKTDSDLLKISKKKFRWSNDLVPMWVGDDGKSGRTSVVVFPVIRLEMEFESADKITICYELNQWNSTPHWKYEIFEKENYSEIYYTSSKLRKLKTSMEEIEALIINTK